MDDRDDPNHDEKINVTLFAEKLRVLYQLAAKDARYPQNRDQLATALRDMSPDRASLTSKSISRVEEIPTRKLSLAIHRDILELFGQGWPNDSYYDRSRAGGDEDIDSFRRSLQLGTAGFTIRRISRNAREFPSEDLFVLELVDQTASEIYTGLMIAKPGDVPIKEIEGDLAGIKLGRAGFSEFTVNVRLPEGAEVKSWRSSDMETSSNKNIQFRPRSSNADHIWRVRWRPVSREALPYFDENIDVAHLSVAKIDDEDVLVLQVTAPLPDLEPMLDEANPASSDKAKLEARMRVLAENLVLEQFRRADGTVPVKKDILTIGEVHYKKQPCA